jgi:hypothetical protein
MADWMVDGAALNASWIVFALPEFGSMHDAVKVPERGGDEMIKSTGWVTITFITFVLVFVWLMTLA